MPRPTCHVRTRCAPGSNVPDASYCSKQCPRALGSVFGSCAGTHAQPKCSMSHVIIMASAAAGCPGLQLTKLDPLGCLPCNSWLYSLKHVRSRLVHPRAHTTAHMVQAAARCWCKINDAWACGLRKRAPHTTVSITHSNGSYRLSHLHHHHATKSVSRHQHGQQRAALHMHVI